MCRLDNYDLLYPHLLMIYNQQIKDYLKSKLTLIELFANSQSFLIKHKFRNEIKTYLKEDFSDMLQCGSDYYKDIPVSMKSGKIENKYGS